MRRVLLFSAAALFAQPGGQHVQLVADITREGCLPGGIRPGREQQQTALGTGVEIMAGRLVERGKAVARKLDDGDAALQGSPFYITLAGADEGRYQHGALPALSQQGGSLLLQGFVV